MGKKIHSRVGSLFWLAIGVYVAGHSYQLGLGRLRHPGPGCIFFMAALLLIILSAVDLAGTLIGKRERERDKMDLLLWSGFRWQKVLLTLGGLSAYTYFFNFAGFSLSTFLLMIFLYKGIEPTRWWIAIGSSLMTTVLSYVIFEVWLEVPFPKGFVGF